MIVLSKKLLAHPWFENLSLLAIAAAALLVGLETSETLMLNYGSVFKFLDKAILFVFALEVIVRFLASGPKFHRYFYDGWNVFDFSLVTLSLVLAGSPYLTVLRILRILRTLRLVRTIPKLRLIVAGLINGLSSMGYVAVLLGLIFYCYAVVGVFLFRPFAQDYFGSLSSALMTLFQIITLEGWVDILVPLKEAYPFAAPFYFISFIVLGTMIFLNLFIGAIVNGMEEARGEDDGDVVLKELRQIRNLLEETKKQ
jgi:voltage-gated sodium channel